MEWKPIEELPEEFKDGRGFLACNENYDDSPEVVCFAQDPRRPENIWKIQGCEGYWHQDTFTHWQPCLKTEQKDPQHETQD